MKLRAYISSLQSIAKNHGNDLEVIYAIDEEGNAFHPVHYAPQAGRYRKDDHQFLASENNVDCVCIN